MDEVGRKERMLASLAVNKEEVAESETGIS